jgi:hypothetical protein
MGWLRLPGCDSFEHEHGSLSLAHRALTTAFESGVDEIL